MQDAPRQFRSPWRRCRNGRAIIRKWTLRATSSIRICFVMALLLYRLLYPLAFLLAAPFYVSRLRRRERGRSSQSKPDGYHLGIAQRFGRYDPELRARLADGSAPVWLCSISVGETIVALKLARALRQQNPSARIVISVTTSTGYELLLREKADWLIPIYNPLDFRFAARAALNVIRPKTLVLIEGGIWPNLLSLARANGVRTVLANARLSPRSERRWQKFRWLAEPVWRLFVLICIPTNGDAERFASIGVPADRMKQTGNIKFDNAGSDAPSREEEFRALIAPMGFRSEIIVAGSTWDPEEKALVSVLGELRSEWPDLRLIIVPRHVERADEIARSLAPLRVARRSQSFTGEADILLVDTTGELRDWYRLATVVFVGKSLPGIAEVGGQNIGEPAALGLPVVVGPHMENFRELTAQLLENKAAIRVSETKALAGAMRTLLSDSNQRTAMGERAKATLTTHQGATARTAALLN